MDNHVFSRQWQKESALQQHHPLEIPQSFERWEPGVVTPVIPMTELHQMVHGFVVPKN